MRLRHTGIVVRNIDKAILFYGHLGFNLKVRELESGKFIDQVVGILDVTVETAKLINHEREMIELLQYHSHPSSLDFSLRAASQPGLSHIAFTVDDVAKTLDTIESLGGLRVNHPAINIKRTVKVAYCHDPEGNLFELVEELPSES